MFNFLKKIVLFTPFILFVGLMGCQSVRYSSEPLATTVKEPQQSHLMDTEKKLNKPVIAYVLGSGGARGYAHIGVLRVLEQYGIRPDFIVGTSAGSMVGVLYASGKNAAEIEGIANSLKVSDVRDFSINLQGFFDGKKIEDFINEQVGHKMLQDLDIPMYVVATRLDTGDKTVFSSGNVGQAVRSSVSIPMMFEPMKIGAYEYVDGGLASPVPVKVAKDLGADMVIAINILAQPHYTKTENFWGLFNQTINIMQNHMADEEMSYADIIIEPNIREKAHIFDVTGRSVMIEAGRQAALEKIDLIQQKIDELQNLHHQQE